MYISRLKGMVYTQTNRLKWTYTKVYCCDIGEHGGMRGDLTSFREEKQNM